MKETFKSEESKYIMKMLTFVAIVGITIMIVVCPIQSAEQEAKKELCNEIGGKYKDITGEEYCFIDTKAIPVRFDCKGVWDRECELYYIQSYGK